MADKIKPDAHYEVKMKKTVKIGRTWHRPSDVRVILKGTLVSEYKDAIASFKEVK
jgi:hypothetical protein